jgi:hypothetical protein
MLRSDPDIVADEVQERRGVDHVASHLGTLGALPQATGLHPNPANTGFSRSTTGNEPAPEDRKENDLTSTNAVR